MKYIISLIITLLVMYQSAFARPNHYTNIVPFPADILYYRYNSSPEMDNYSGKHACVLMYTYEATVPKTETLYIYDKRGRYLGRFLMYTRHSYPTGATYYTYWHTCESIANKAKRRTGSTTVYVEFTNHVCFKITDMRRNQGNKSLSTVHVK